MPESDADRIKLAMGSVREIMDIFRAERYIYLGGATAAMLLLLYTAVVSVRSGTLTLENGGALLGAGGLFAVTGARTIVLLQQSFGLIRQILLPSTTPEEAP